MKDYTVQPIKREDAIPWITLKHYAKRIPSISYSFGLIRGDLVCGVCTFGMPASNHLCKGICGKEHATKVLELNRVCLDRNHKNEASYLIGGALRLINTPPDIAKIIVSFADTGMGHIGTIYQATNWIYTGVTDYGRKPRFDKPRKGSNKHGRHDKTGNKIIRRTRKHRYIYFLGSKMQKKEMLKALNYPILPYPKGESKRYDMSAEFPKQVQMF